ncbi:hypothetical protein HF319_06500, partial [Xanthomonas sp. Kuri4-1]
MRPGVSAPRGRAIGVALISTLALALSACNAPQPDEQEAVSAHAQEQA